VTTTWQSIASLAGELGAKYPELVAAQWALESGWGKFTSGKFNFFGIKGKGTKKETKEWDGGKFITIIDEFKDYASPREAVKDLIDKWYKDYKGYKGVNSASTRNEAARMLVKEGYATDPAYADKLIDIMNKNAVPEKTENQSLPNVELLDAVKFFKGEKHQIEAWKALQSSLSPEQRKAFTLAYRKPSSPSATPPKVRFPLDVAYFYQRDSKTGHGERSCQSSAIAMVIEYIDPRLIVDDDDYLRIVLKYGDTVSQLAQKKALDSLGIKNQFRMNGTEADLTKILDKGYPVPVGILHRGSIHAPSGGGHWVTLIGYNSTHFFVHDPFGELDLINGGYPKAGLNDGRNVRYSRKNLMKRWLIASNSDGWLWDLSMNQIQ
jgi:hypothetical protein